MAGALYERSLPILITAVAVTQIIALVLLIATLRRQRKIRAQAASDAGIGNQSSLSPRPMK
jgi:hypothetical protein